MSGVTPLVSRIAELVEAAHQKAPLVFLAIVALLVVPVLAVISRFIHRKFGARSLPPTDVPTIPTGIWTNPPISGTTIRPWSMHAWLTVEGAGNDKLPLSGQMIRIGRHKDNDIRLTEKSVHRYHAVIERTQEAGFVITDLSGAAGNGIRINGQHTAKAGLANGDEIELGRVKLKFESAPV